MIDFDRETWIYLVLIAVALVYFLWTSGKTKQKKKNIKNRNFRKRYFDRKRKKKSA